MYDRNTTADERVGIGTDTVTFTAFSFSTLQSEKQKAKVHVNLSGLSPAVNPCVSETFQIKCVYDSI